MSYSTGKNLIRRALCRSLLRHFDVTPITESQWTAIKIFFGGCAYCGSNDEDLTKEHLVGINAEEKGTDHPSNIVPACSECQGRQLIPNSMGGDTYQDNWPNHLRHVIAKREKGYDEELFRERKQKIDRHHVSYFGDPKKFRNARKKIDDIVKAVDMGINDLIRKAEAEAIALRMAKSSREGKTDEI